jgi:hypothetical protein
VRTFAIVMQVPHRGFSPRLLGHPVLGALGEGCELPHSEFAARGDRWRRLEQGLDVDVGGLVTTENADDDFGDELGAQRPEPATPILAELRLAQDVEPQRCLPAQPGLPGSGKPSSVLDSGFIFIIFATSCPAGRPSRLPRIRLRCASDTIGSFTTVDGSSSSGMASFVSISRAWLRGVIGAPGTGKNRHHSISKAAGSGRLPRRSGLLSANSGTPPAALSV